MEGDDEYGFDEEFTAEDFRHMDRIESAAYAGEFNSHLISATVVLSITSLKGHLTHSPHPLKPLWCQVVLRCHLKTLHQTLNCNVCLDCSEVPILRSLYCM
jgi:hypothetical protein